MARYERHARLASTWASLTAAQRKFFEACEAQLEAIFLGWPVGLGLEQL